MAQAITVRSRAPVRPRAATSALPVALLEWCLLAVLVVGAPLLYLPVVTHNLPAAAGIDERNALEVVRRFHHGSLNPEFFQYPTLYFYLVYLLALPLHYTSVNVMVVGRVFDLALIGLTAFIVYAFCRDRLHSRPAGLVGAVFVLGSTEMAGIAYLHPDLLMTAAGTAALYYLVDYFESRSLRAWGLGLVLMGVSIGCKYTALILYIAYAAAEILASLRERHLPASVRGSGARYSRRLCVGVLLAAAGALLLSSWLMPVGPLLAMLLKARAGYQVGPGSFYVEVFGRLRRILAELGLLSAGAALLCRFSRDVYESIAIKRLYYGLAIILVVSVLCTPYCLIHPLQFAFDLGSLTRSNIVVAGGHAQWGAYTGWLLRDEGALAVLLGMAGIAMFATRARRQLHLVVIYLALYLYVLGSSRIGYARYLTPAVALFYIGTGFAVVHLWNYPAASAKAARLPRRALVVLLLGGACMQMLGNVARTRRQARANNSFFASYTMAKQATTGTAYYAGYAPSIELQEAGIRTQELSWPSVSAEPLGQHLSCGDTLILNTPQAAKNHVDAGGDRSVTVLIDAPGTGQEAQQVLRKSGCP